MGDPRDISCIWIGRRACLSNGLVDKRTHRIPCNGLYPSLLLTFLEDLPSGLAQQTLPVPRDYHIVTCRNIRFFRRIGLTCAACLSFFLRTTTRISARIAAQLGPRIKATLALVIALPRLSPRFSQTATRMDAGRFCQCPVLLCNRHIPISSHVINPLQPAGSVSLASNLIGDPAGA